MTEPQTTAMAAASSSLHLGGTTETKMKKSKDSGGEMATTAIGKNTSPNPTFSSPVFSSTAVLGLLLLVLVWFPLRTYINRWRFHRRCQKYPNLVVVQSTPKKKKARSTEQEQQQRHHQPLRDDANHTRRRIAIDTITSLLARLGQVSWDFLASFTALGWSRMQQYGPVVVTHLADATRTVAVRCRPSFSETHMYTTDDVNNNDNNNEEQPADSTPRTPLSWMKTAVSGMTADDAEGIYDGPRLETPPSLRQRHDYQELNNRRHVTFQQEEKNNNEEEEQARTASLYGSVTPYYYDVDGQTIEQEQQTAKNAKRMETPPSKTRATMTPASAAVPRQATPHPNAGIRKRRLMTAAEAAAASSATKRTMPSLSSTPSSSTPSQGEPLKSRAQTFRGRPSSSTSGRFVPFSPSRNVDVDTNTSFSEQLRKRRLAMSSSGETNGGPALAIENGRDDCDEDGRAQQSGTKRRRLNVGGRISLQGTSRMTTMNRASTRIGGYRTTFVNNRRLSILGSPAFQQKDWLASSTHHLRPIMGKREREERDERLLDDLNRVEKKVKPVAAAAPTFEPSPTPAPATSVPPAASQTAPAIFAPLPSTKRPPVQFGAGTVNTPSTNTNSSTPSFGTNTSIPASTATAAAASSTATTNLTTQPFLFGQNPAPAAPTASTIAPTAPTMAPVQQTNLFAAPKNDAQPLPTSTIDPHMYVTQKTTNVTKNGTPGLGGDPHMFVTQKASNVTGTGTTGLGSTSLAPAPKTGGTPNLSTQSAMPVPAPAFGAAKAPFPPAPAPVRAPAAPNPFGGGATQTPAAQASNPFGAMQTPAAQTSNPFGGGATQTPVTQPTNAFGTGAMQTPATQTMNPFGGGTTKTPSAQTINPFGGGATQTPAAQTINPFGAGKAQSGPPSNPFGGTNATNGVTPSATNPFGGIVPSATPAANPFSTQAPPAPAMNGMNGFNGTNKVNDLNGSNFMTQHAKPFGATNGTENNPFGATPPVNPANANNGFKLGAAVAPTGLGGGNQGGAGARRRQKKTGGRRGR